MSDTFQNTLNLERHATVPEMHATVPEMHATVPEMLLISLLRHLLHHVD
jgi:hypothetical protein